MRFKKSGLISLYRNRKKLFKCIEKEIQNTASEHSSHHKPYSTQSRLSPISNEHFNGNELHLIFEIGGLRHDY